MDAGALDLVIVWSRSAAGRAPLRVPIERDITTLGSDPGADVGLPDVPPRWLVIRRDAGGLLVKQVASGQAARLEVGGELAIDGLILRLEAPAPEGLSTDALASSLASAESPDEALERILDGIMAATGADTGALIVSRQGSYTVAVAHDSIGGALPGAGDLLSDTLVTQVLGSGEDVHVADVAGSARYASVPSVVSMRLRSVMCLPMRLDGRILGALFLGKRDARRPFDDRLAGELKVLVALAVPFLAQVRRADEARAARPDSRDALDAILGDSPAIADVRRLIARVAPSDLSVLVRGPTGTGKELVARALHAASPRASRPLIAVNVMAVPETLLGSELFGHKKGAFTGAERDKKGFIEAADGSTLFLDEVGDMPPAMQAALLRVLEAREVQRIGETQARPVDFRLVTATHKDLDAEVAAGRFREDLLFRLREVTVSLPPLAARGDDLLLLARLFLRQAEQQLSLPVHSLGSACRAVLLAHPWPGNVRELRATMRRAALLADGTELRPEDLQLGAAPRAAASAPPLGDLDRPLDQARDAFVKAYVAAAVERHGGDREAAARALGISIRSLYRHLD
jgi:DNA-binding NtrC family response regulator